MLGPVVCLLGRKVIGVDAPISHHVPQGKKHGLALAGGVYCILIVFFFNYAYLDNCIYIYNTMTYVIQNDIHIFDSLFQYTTEMM